MSSLVKKAPNAEKGARYVGLLDAALSNGSWADVPELARKVEKHAPQRKCMFPSDQTRPASTEVN